MESLKYETETTKVTLKNDSDKGAGATKDLRVAAGDATDDARGGGCKPGAVPAAEPTMAPASNVSAITGNQ